MSIYASKHVWKLQGLAVSEKLLLLYLADCHNGKTGQCNPLHKTVADELDFSVRNVKRLIKSCEKKNVLTVLRTKHEANKNAANKYTFPGLGGDKSGKPSSKGGDKSGKQVVTNPAKNLTEIVTQNQKIEPEVGTGTPAAKPRGGKNIFSNWEKGKEKRESKKEILTPKGRSQLKYSASYIEKREHSPEDVIEFYIAEFDRVRDFIRDQNNYTDQCPGLAWNPTTGALAKWVGDVVDCYEQRDKNPSAALLGEPEDFWEEAS